MIGSHAEYALHTSPDLPVQAQQALGRIRAESARMGHLVEDLLRLARLDAGRPLVYDEVDLTRLVVDAVSDARVTAVDHHWQLDLPAEPVTIRGDQHALHQALSNLLVNARTHTPAGSTVVVTVAAATDGTVMMQIIDDGPGIPPGVQPHIFERFVRADNNDPTTARGATRPRERRRWPILPAVRSVRFAARTGRRPVEQRVGRATRAHRSARADVNRSRRAAAAPEPAH